MSQSHAPQLVQALQTKLASVADALGGATELQDAIDERDYDSVLAWIEALERENRDLRDRVAELEGRVTPDPERKEYDELTKAEKVHAVRTLVARTAAKQSGKAYVGYRDVLARFDQHPSRGHAYDLMDAAGNADGFTYGEHNGTKRLRVTLDAVTDTSVLHAVNTPDGRTGGEN